MTKIRKIQNGDGITFTIYKDGELVNFRLTLVKRENSWSKYHEFIFISDCKKYYTNSPYSGGNVLGIYEVPLHRTLNFSTNLNRVFRIYLVSKS